jgi:diguanylate cyclase (GGDEF)-like protein
MNRDIDKVRKTSMRLHDEEVERFRALLEYNILDTEPDPAFDELARLAAYICRTPIALITFVDENREWFKSVIGIDSGIREVPRDKSFGAYVINHPEDVLSVTKPLEDERTKQNPFLRSYPDINFIAGLPLTDRNGRRIGSLCVAGFQQKDLSFEQVSLLQTIAGNVVLHLERRRSVPDSGEPVPPEKTDGDKENAGAGASDSDEPTNIHALIGKGGDIGEKILRDMEIIDEEENSTTIRKDIKDLIDKLERQNRKLILLCDMDELLQASHDEEEVYTIVTNYSNRLFPDESGALFIFNDVLNILECVSEWGDKINSEREFLSDKCWALRLGRLHYVDNAPSELYCQHLSETSNINHYCVPMVARGKTLGLLYLQSGIRSAGGAGDERENIYTSHIVSTMAKLTALALGNIKHHEALQNYAIYDSLTGLFNRRYMEETLKREISRVARNREPLGLIMVDIDHFKQFNDTYGHAAGDMLLRSIGDFFKDRIRREDIACRYGGEEFVLILPGSSLENTCRRAEQLHEEIKRVRVRHRGSFISSVEVSMGVVVFSEHGTSAELLLESADKALYKAKAQGRNRIVVA